MAHNELPDKLTMISYLSQFFEYFRKESVKPAKGKDIKRTSNSFKEISSVK